MLPVGVLLEYQQKIILFIKRSEISSCDVFLTIRMEVAVSATTDFECNIIFFSDSNLEILLVMLLVKQPYQLHHEDIAFPFECCLSWSKSFLFQFCIVFIELFLTSAFCPVFFFGYFSFSRCQKIYLV